MNNINLLLKKQSYQSISHLYILYRFCDTRIIKTSHDVTHKTMHRFFTIHGSAPPNLLANLSFAMDQNQLIHYIIGFKYAVPCIVRSEALRSYSDTPVLTDPRSPIVTNLTMHGASYINPSLLDI